MDNVHVDVDCGHIDCHRVGASEGREVPVPEQGQMHPMESETPSGDAGVIPLPNDTLLQRGVEKNIINYTLHIMFYPKLKILKKSRLYTICCSE